MICLLCGYKFLHKKICKQVPENIVVITFEIFLSFSMSLIVHLESVICPKLIELYKPLVI